MAKIIIRRTKTLWQDRDLDYIILVDRKEVGRIGNDSEVE